MNLNLKKQKIPFWAWIIIALLLLIVLSQKGIINIPFIPGTIFDPDDTPTGTCSLSLNKSLIAAGETVRGTIYGESLANCIIYARLNSGIWTNIGSYRLDPNGQFSYEIPVNIPGVYEVLLICVDSVGISCKTNTEILTVIGGTNP
ncbi:hypothetical protein LCGC14_1783730 [marine sediment metagenome]|uniref:Bacterial Ig-like domain-containing protein n=1 Tax=marine sediment metagenome TaxID=412755 RepID=A0A0F9JU92_9ZZZZ